MVLTKIDADTIANVGTQEVRRVYSRAQVNDQITRLTARLAEFQEMLDELDK